jgi:hypothetical protein
MSKIYRNKDGYLVYEDKGVGIMIDELRDANHLMELLVDRSDRPHLIEVLGYAPNEQMNAVLGVKEYDSHAGYQIFKVPFELKEIKNVK